MNIVQIPEYSLEQIGRNAYYSIPFKVYGYWSSDTIRISIRRDWGDGKSWQFSVNQSSGGRDTKEVADDADAIVNFANALMQASSLIKYLKSQEAVLESFYQDERRVVREQLEKERVEMQERIEADPALGESAAAALVEQMIVASKAGKSVELPVYPRGSDTAPNSVEIQTGEYVNTTFYLCSDRISKKNLIKYLSEMSVRTKVVTV